jgi:hypothetical protein
LYFQEVKMAVKPVTRRAAMEADAYLDLGEDKYES